MLSPDFARAAAMPINPCTGAPGATPHWTCIAANPPGHASPPRYSWHRGQKVAPGRRRPSSGRTKRALLSATEDTARKFRKYMIVRTQMSLATGLLVGAFAWATGLQFAAARAHFEQSLRIYDPERDREAKFRFGRIPKPRRRLFCSRGLVLRRCRARTGTHGRGGRARGRDRSCPDASQRVLLPSHTRNPGATLKQPCAPGKT